jgi:branched-chain amino acid transport system substrate-binding protein
MKRRNLILGATAAITATRARAQGKPVRLGVLNDQSGVFADFQGPGSVIAAKLAIEDFGGTVNGVPIELVVGDHQNKPDIGMAIARGWLDQGGVDVILDVPNSSIALAVAALVTQRNSVFIGSGAGTADLTGAHCSPNIVHWTYDTWQIGHTLGKAVTDRGGKTWYTLAADYVFGADLDRYITEAVNAAGGKVVGGAKAPFPTSDFSSYLISAQSSGAQVLSLDNAGDDTTTSLKQAAEFGLNKTMLIAGPVYNINTAKGVGLEVSQGVLSVSPFYWDLNDGTRAFSKRYAERQVRHAMPNDMQAGVYASVIHYLKAVAKVGSAQDGRAVVAAMKAIPTDDPLFGKGTVRADGRKLHPVYLLQTKTPAESHGDWDFFKVISTVPADQAFRPIADGKCSMEGL